MIRVLVILALAVVGFAAEPLRIVCFGDSITGHRPSERHTYQQHYLKYADLLQLMCEARLGVGRAEVLNSGWSGDGTQPNKTKAWPGGVARAQTDIVDLKPQIAVILFGGNDNAKTEEKVARTTAGLRSIYQTAQDAGIKVLALQYPPALAVEENVVRSWKHLSKTANPIIAAVAKELDIPVLDLGPAMVAAAKKHGRPYLVDHRDGVHLRPGGELVFARTIFTELDRLGWIR